MSQLSLRTSSAVRIAAVALAVTLTSLTACQRHQNLEVKDGLIQVRLQADWYPQPEQGGYFNAIVKGYYRAEGLDVTILPLSGYTSGMQVLASGNADFVLASSDQTLEAVARDLPVVAVDATMQHDPQAVMVHQNSPIHSLADLEDHTVAAQPGAVWFKFLVSQYHMKNVRETPATHSIANFLADPNYVQQVFVTSEPYFVSKAGGDFRTMLISSAGYDPYRVLDARTDLAEDHPEVVKKFVRASIKGWQDYLRDPGPANALILRLNPAQNPAQMAYTLQALKDGRFVTGPDISGAEIGQMTPERWAVTNAQLTSLGVIRKPMDATKAYTLKFLP